MTTTTTALARAPQVAPLATYNAASSDVAAITAALERASREAHLVSPATSVGALPEGCSVAMSTVLVDVARETYNVAGGGDDDGGGGKGGKLGLGKTALDRIAAAAGVSWDPDRSRRLDDGKDPRYCAWLAVGTVRTFDGALITFQGSKDVDLREGSPQVEALCARYRTKLEKWERSGKQGWPPKEPHAQLREQRMHLVSMAETKARLRAIRSLGVRTAYAPEELRKPFVVARMAFTGQTSDPELRRTFAVMQAQAFLGARSALYGGSAPALPAAPAPAALPAPPVGQTIEPEDGELFDDEPAPAATTMPPGRDTAPAANVGQDPLAGRSPIGATPDGPPAAPPTERSGFAIPGGRSKGTPIEDADDRDLTYWAGRIDDDLAQGRGKPQFADRDRALVAAIRAEQGRRCGGGSGESSERGTGDDDIPF